MSSSTLAYSETMPRPFLGRTALVTGAGNGLGREIALALMSNGARVIVAGRNAAALEETSRILQRGERSSRVARVDVSDPDSVAQLAEELAEEQISIIVNNAGVGGPVKPLLQIEPAEWDDVFAVNVRGVYLVCRAFLPGMIARGGGDVVNIASVTGKRPLAGRTPYAASKMAVIGLTTTLAAEVGQYGVAVNSLSPGPVRGERMERNFRLEADRSGTTVAQAEAEFTARSLLGRMLEEVEVGQAVVSMLQMSGLHGADIDLSAGMVAR